jgi:hypothetical protein
LITEEEGTDVEEVTEAVEVEEVDTEEVEVVVEEEDIGAAEVVVARVKIRGEVDLEPMVRILLRLRSSETTKSA